MTCLETCVFSPNGKPEAFFGPSVMVLSSIHPINLEDLPRWLNLSIQGAEEDKAALGSRYEIRLRLDEVESNLYIPMVFHINHFMMMFGSDFVMISMNGDFWDDGFLRGSRQGVPTKVDWVPLKSTNGLEDTVGHVTGRCWRLLKHHLISVTCWNLSILDSFGILCFRRLLRRATSWDGFRRCEAFKSKNALEYLRQDACAKMPWSSCVRANVMNLQSFFGWGDD